MKRLRARGSRVRSTFSAEAKVQLAHDLPEGRQERRALLAGLALSAGSLHLRAGERVVAVRSDLPAVARVAVSLLKEEGLVTRVLRRRGATSRLRVEGVGAAVETLLAAWEFLPGDGGLGSLLRTRAAKRAFLRGLFLGSGSVSDPHASPHLEIVLAHEGAVHWARFALRAFGLRPHVTRRRGAFCLYLKGAGDIAEFLRVVGASSSLLALEEIRAEREVRNRVNRLVNAETANMEKAAEAAAGQIEAIRAIVAARGWEGIPRKLRELARLRLEYPEASLRELGALCEPALGKSSVSYRMRQLVQLKEALVNRRTKEHGRVGEDGAGS